MRDISLSSAIADRMLLTPRETAQVLSVCEKTLWSLTRPRGPIPCLRLGRSVRYSVEALREYVARQVESSVEVQP